MKMLNVKLVINDLFVEDNEYGINEQAYLVLADAVANIGGIIEVTPVSKYEFQEVASA